MITEEEEVVDLALNNKDAIIRLYQIGVLRDKDSCRNYNVGESDYAEHLLQPWSIWLDYGSSINEFDKDIIKRVLRRKKGDSRAKDYEKIIHICQERIRQINCGLE